MVIFRPARVLAAALILGLTAPLPGQSAPQVLPLDNVPGRSDTYLPPPDPPVIREKSPPSASTPDASSQGNRGEELSSVAGPLVEGWSEGLHDSAVIVPQPPVLPPGGVFSYPQGPHEGQLENQGWPVAYPFQYYPQGAVTDDGAGVYQCLLPADRPDICFCTPPPCYFGTVYFSGAILDRRTNLEAIPLYFDSGAAEVLNTDDFNFETEAGWRLGFWASHPSGLDWNVDYFNVSNFQSSLTRTDAAGLTENFFGFTDTPQPSLTAEYESNLQSIEWTVRARQWYRVAPLISFRYLQLEEQFNSLRDVTNRVGNFSEADNELYGLQFGVQALLLARNSWRIETVLKAAPYYNDIDLTATINPAAGGSQMLDSDRSSVAFVGDARVAFVCQMGPRVNFFISYQALWMEGVALAPNQNNNISFATGVQGLDTSGVLYQGGDLGFQLSW